MHEHELNRRLERLERIEEHNQRMLRGLEEELGLIHRLVRAILQQLNPQHSPPAAGNLSATFDTSGDPMNAVLVATPPTLRGDGTALAPTDIASITYQKTSLLADGVTQGPQTVLQTNNAVAGAGLATTDVTFTDTSSTPGDTYTFFVTDTNGDAGALSNAVQNPIAVKESAPAAGSLQATFS
jgi:hypothetical protein